jgi:hypothetical protein
MTRSHITTCIIMALAALLMLSAGAYAQDLAGLMKATGLKYTALEGIEDSWRVPFDAEGGKTLDVFVTYNDDKKHFALIFATVVDREDNYVYNRDVLAKSMKLNNDLSGVKFVLDEKNGDIDCQTEVYMPTITAESLAMFINLIASVGDENTAELSQLAGGAEGRAPAPTTPAATAPQPRNTIRVAALPRPAEPAAAPAQ